MAAGSLKVAQDQTIATGTPLGNVGTVSYTHLDVYKRQRLR